MKINDLLPGKMWGIESANLEEIFKRYNGMTDSETLSAQLARFTQNPVERDEFLLDDGVAVIPVTGPIFKRASIWSWLFGGGAISTISSVFTDAINDTAVQSIVFDIDSPGGVVSGTGALAEQIYKARKIKPVVAFANGSMASAAYWIGSAAQKVVVEKTSQVGSIGVVMVHYDYSKSDEQYGVKRTYLSAGKYKTLGNDAEPLSADARKKFQSDLDYIYTIFTDTVALHRGTNSQAVIENMADGRIFTGQQAIDAGLADITGSLETAIETARGMVKHSGSLFTGINYGGKKMENKNITTLEQLAAAYPDLVNQIKAQAASEAKSAGNQAVEDERTRILGLADIQFGAETGEKFRAVIKTGVSVEQFTAIRGAAPENQGQSDHEEKSIEKAKSEMLTALKGSGADNPGAGSGQSEGLGFLALVEQYRQVNTCSKSTAMQMVAKQNPKAHQVFLSACN